jgi:hypothetical protein
MSRTIKYILLLIVFTVGCKDNPKGPDDNPELENVSYASQVRPILQQHGCIGCHGGENNLFVDSVAGLLQGGLNGPAVNPGNANESLIIRKMSPNPPFGDRMPLGGLPVPESQINVIRVWINEGAQNN